MTTTPSKYSQIILLHSRLFNLHIAMKLSNSPSQLKVDTIKCLQPSRQPTFK